MEEILKILQEIKDAIEGFPYLDEGIANDLCEEIRELRKVLISQELDKLEWKPELRGT